MKSITDSRSSTALFGAVQFIEFDESEPLMVTWLKYVDSGRIAFDSWVALAKNPDDMYVIHVESAEKAYHVFDCVSRIRQLIISGGASNPENVMNASISEIICNLPLPENDSPHEPIGHIFSKRVGEALERLRYPEVKCDIAADLILGLLNSPINNFGSLSDCA